MDWDTLVGAAVDRVLPRTILGDDLRSYVIDETLNGLPSDPTEAEARRALLRFEDAMNITGVGGLLIKPGDIWSETKSGAGGRLPTVETVDGVGVLRLTEAFPDRSRWAEYAQSGHDQIAEAVDACGWIIDITDVKGPAIGPHLLTAAAILGEGPLLLVLRSFDSGGIEIEPGLFADLVSYENGSLLLNSSAYPAPTEDMPPVFLSRFRAGTQVDDPAPPISRSVSIALLFEGSDAEAGGAILTAMATRDDVRTFGTTGSGPTFFYEPVWIGEMYGVLTQTGLMYDLDGETVVSVEPDESVSLTASDPTGQIAAFNAAMDWLLEQDGCRTQTP